MKKRWLGSIRPNQNTFEVMLLASRRKIATQTDQLDSQADLQDT